MKLAIMGILLTGILALIPYLPATAQDSSNITITMTGAKEFSINLTPANWSFGIVTPNTENTTDLTQFTLTVDPTSNCNVNTFITGEDAVWADDPGAYNWTLSSNGNDKRVYALWFRGSDMGDYIQITKNETAFYSGISPGPEDAKQFGLKLLAPWPDFGSNPGYFSVGNATMQTHVTISAVAA